MESAQPIDDWKDDELPMGVTKVFHRLTLDFAPQAYAAFNGMRRKASILRNRGFRRNIWRIIRRKSKIADPTSAELVTRALRAYGWYLDLKGKKRLQIVEDKWGVRTTSEVEILL